MSPADLYIESQMSHLLIIMNCIGLLTLCYVVMLIASGIPEKKLKKSPNHASVNLNRLVEHFSSIMQDSSELSHAHSNIADIVNQKYMDVKGNVITHRITSEIVDTCKCIGKLKRHSSPGIDGIVAEFIN